MMNEFTHPTWPGIPRASELIRDAALSVRTQLATTITTVFVLATACFAVLVTTGQAAATEARVVEQIDSAGTRLIVLSDNGGNSGILPAAPGRIADLTDVSWAFGLGAAVEGTNPALRESRAALRMIIGDIPPDLLLVQGRLPRPGEAIAGISATSQLNLGPGLGRVRPAGGAGSEAVGVVGVFAAEGPLAHLNDVVLIAGEPGMVETLRYVYVMATDVAVIERLETVLASSTPALKPASVTIETPTGAIALRDVIAGRLGAASRQLMALVMGVGAVIIAVTMFASTALRRPEFGRRRALGATRSALVATLLVQTGFGALGGVILGTIGGLVALGAATGALPSWRFTLGVAGLALILALVASIPIAIAASNRDPLRILRVP